MLSVNPESELVSTAAILGDGNLLVGSIEKPSAKSGTATFQSNSKLHLFSGEGRRLCEPRLLPGVSKLTTICQSPDRRWIALTSDTGQLIVFDSRRGLSAPTNNWLWQEFAFLQAHQNAVNDAVWLGDEPRLATACQDGSCAFWNFTGISALSEFQYPEPILEDRWQVSGMPLTTIASSIDGSRLLTAGEDNVVRIWDTDNHSELLSLPPRRARIRAMNFSPNGRFLMIAETKLIDVIRVMDD